MEVEPHRFVTTWHLISICPKPSVKAANSHGAASRQCIASPASKSDKINMQRILCYSSISFDDLRSGLATC
jgi:hypothetical protein